MHTMLTHAEIKIFGTVQGVFFRHFTKKTADKLKVTGWVMNADDGAVHIEVEGEDAAIKELLAWCHQGPPGAVVHRVEYTDSPMLKDFATFEIRYA
jgi:acylphosphatase